MTDALGTITERLIRKYGKEGLRELQTAPLTKSQLLAMDADRYAYVNEVRPHDVQIALMTEADAKRAKAHHDTRNAKRFYAQVRAGEVTMKDANAWIAEQFADDFENFQKAYPQVAGEDGSIWSAMPNGNAQILFAICRSREVFPTFAELASAYQVAMVPKSGFPKLTIWCPDGEYRTGKPLADAIRNQPLELLEPPKHDRNRPAHETQSASEFLATDPVLNDPKLRPEQPLLLRERFNREWGNFLVGDIGRALKVRADQHGLGSFLAGWMWDYMVKTNLTFTQKGFEQAALAIVAKITIHDGDDSAPLVLVHEDIGGAKSGGMVLHDGGGNRENQLPLGLSMAGQRVESQYNPDH